MTLKDFFDFLGEHPTYITLYFLAMPVVAFAFNWISGEEGHRAPWVYIYSGLVFATCVPGVLSVGLSVYFFLFERGSIMNTNILTQVLPILSMVLTISIIRRNVALEYIPGSEKISSLMLLIGATFVLMYILDRTRIFMFVTMSIYQFLLILVVLLLGIRWAARRIMA